MENASISAEFGLDAVIGRQNARANARNAFPEDFADFLKPQPEEQPAPRRAERNEWSERPERSERSERPDAAERRAGEVRERDGTDRLAEERETRDRQADDAAPSRNRDDRADAFDDRPDHDRPDHDRSDKGGRDAASPDEGNGENHKDDGGNSHQDKEKADIGGGPSKAPSGDGTASKGDSPTAGEAVQAVEGAATNQTAAVPSMVPDLSAVEGEVSQNQPVKTPAAPGAGVGAVNGAGVAVDGRMGSVPLPADMAPFVSDEAPADTPELAARQAAANTAAAQEQVRAAAVEASAAAQAPAAKSQVTSLDTGATLPGGGVETLMTQNKPRQNAIAAQQTVQTVIQNTGGGAQTKTANAAALAASAAAAQRDVSGGQRIAPDPTFLPNLSESAKGQAIEIKNPVTPGQRSQNAGLPVRVDTLALRITSAAQAGQRQFEIMLDPPELGRIDVKLEFSSDGQLRAHLTADRHDTLDLLQRDARMLERTLQTQGLKMEDGSLQFSLRDQGNGQGDRAANGDGTGLNGDIDTDAGETEDAPIPIRQIALPGRLNVVL